MEETLQTTPNAEETQTQDVAQVQPAAEPAPEAAAPQQTAPEPQAQSITMSG